MRDEEITIGMSDGVSVALRLYRPAGQGKFPVLFAASPYRFDNDDIPETNLFPWRETGPIAWYVEQGYAYAHLDVRGTGKSGGEYGFFDRRERRDLYEVIEWLGEQPWSNGRVGGIGHSYYAASQWCMASERPPSLACIAPYDGHMDFGGGWAYTGGIPSAFMSEWWNGNVRPINARPANGAAPRILELDLPHLVSMHPSGDAFWQERSIVERLGQVTIPVYSIGVWSKLDLHLAGNIMGYERVSGPKKLLLSGAPSMAAAQAEFESVDFHREMLLPFYDRWLKGLQTGYEARPAVQYFVKRSGLRRESDCWPPRESRRRTWHLSAEPSGSLISLNDGSLQDAPPAQKESCVKYSYPDSQWTLGPVCMTPEGPDPVRRVLTFTTAPMQQELTLAGAGELVLYLQCSREDTDVVVKLSEQLPQDAAERSAGRQPKFIPVTKGWLRASHRQEGFERRTGDPVRLRADPLPLEAGRIYELRVPLMATAHRIAPGSRLRIEIANGDSPITDHVFAHIYTPDKVGTDTIHHSAAYPSRLLFEAID